MNGGSSLLDSDWLKLTRVSTEHSHYNTRATSGSIFSELAEIKEKHQKQKFLRISPSLH